MDGYEDITEGKKWRSVHNHFVLGSLTVTSGARSHREALHSGDRHKQEVLCKTGENRVFTLFTLLTLFFDSARWLIGCKNSFVKVLRCKFVSMSGRV